VKRWMIVGGAIALAAVGVSAWKISRSHTSGYATPQKAVIATCHADPNQRLYTLARGLVDGVNTVSVEWRSPAQPPGHSWGATVDRNGSRDYEVLDCKRFSVVSNLREIRPPS
jgi:hypothetical protein